MSNNIQFYRNRLEQQKGQREILENTIFQGKIDLKDKQKELRKHEQALEILKTVGLSTQQQLQYHISDITSLALEAVFKNAYELRLEFVERRNKTECDIYFVREETKIDPISESGGGAIDVASFALRIASWRMNHPKNRNVIILDEPMRFLSSDLQEKASQMIKEISDKLGIQFIIITHEPELCIYADKTFNVSIKKGISKVE